MSNNENRLLEEIKELKEIITNYQNRDIEILNLCKRQHADLYFTDDNNEILDKDIIINKFKQIIKREMDLHKILESKYLKIEKCNNCHKVYLSGKDTCCRYNKEYKLIHFCSKECLELQR